MTVLHTVAAGETLNQISILYNVPVATLRAANRLTGDEIWMRKTIIVPGVSGEPRSVPQISSSPESEAISQRISAAKKLYPELDVSVVRTVAASCEDLTTVCQCCDWMLSKRVYPLPTTRFKKVTEKELLAYLEMYAYDISKANLHLERDLQWEKGQRRGPLRRLCKSCPNSSDEEQDEECFVETGVLMRTSPPAAGARRRRTTLEMTPSGHRQNSLPQIFLKEKN